MAIATLGIPSTAHAAPGFMVSPPMVDQARSEISFFVGGISEDRTVLKPSGITVELDGEPGPTPQMSQTFSEFAQTAAEASRSWKSPLAVGFVYLWVDDMPAGIADAILDGASGFFRRIPSRTNVYVTLYGRRSQPLPRLKASEMGAHLHDIGYLGGTLPNLAAAIKLDLKALLGDEAPFKVLLVVTDGRDYDDDAAAGSADFTALAEQIHEAGVQLLVVSFPPADFDAEASTRNLFDLATSGAIRRAVEQPVETQTTLASLGQAVADMRRVRLAIPWGWRNFGGTRRVRLDITADHVHRVMEVGRVAVPAGAKRWFVPIAVLAVLLAGAAGAVVLWRRCARGARAGRNEDVPMVAVAAHDLLRRGISAPRSMVELTRSFPKQVGSLIELAPSLLADDRFPLFRTRAGKRRFDEVLALLSARGNADCVLGRELASLLSESVSRGDQPDQVAAAVVARVPEDQWSAFGRMGLDELAHALCASGELFPVLASPHARGVALQIQAALRDESRTMGKAVVVAWLVCAVGQGQRGETLRLPRDRAILGRAPGCDVRLSHDPTIAEQHAAIDERDGRFVLRPMQGKVSVEARSVLSPVCLSDGDTIEIGQNRLVFKCVSSGHTRYAA